MLAEEALNYRNVVRVEVTKPPWSGWFICSQLLLFIPSDWFWLASQEMKMSCWDEFATIATANVFLQFYMVTFFYP